MQEDGGDIVYMGFDDGVVKLKMQVRKIFHGIINLLRAAFQQSAFGWSTAGNDVLATIFIRLFSFFFPPFFFPVFPPSRPFLIEGVLGSKNLFSESCLERPKT